jgi:hypothetical protein
MDVIHGKADDYDPRVRFRVAGAGRAPVDVHPYQEQIDLPKFHVAHCPTLKNMNEIGRSHRYLISARVDGTFRLNVFRGNTMKTENTSLNVCQNCLGTLEFNGFKNNLTRPERTLHVNAFTPANFFEQYAFSLFASSVASHQIHRRPLNLRHVVVQNRLLAAIIPFDGYARPILFSDGAKIVFIGAPINADADN